jgi:hypothetical protein
MHAAPFGCDERDDHRRQRNHAGDDVWREQEIVHGAMMVA